jgi:hypothetical protein
MIPRLCACHPETFWIEQGQGQREQVDGKNRVRPFSLLSSRSHLPRVMSSSFLLLSAPFNFDQIFGLTRVDLLKLIEETVEGVRALPLLFSVPCRLLAPLTID